MTAAYQTACHTFTQTYNLAILLGKLRLTLLFGVVQLRVVLRYCVCVTDVTAKNINSYVYTRAYARARHIERGNSVKAEGRRIIGGAAKTSFATPPSNKEQRERITLVLVNGNGGESKEHLTPQLVESSTLTRNEGLSRIV